ncbi:MAG: MSHA biogenesis protein MshD [Gammaproteobacteria bacterium]|nr:MAG: MSHA biogenesis protein MshD [Gammaproteobacteria bacterium]
MHTDAQKNVCFKKHEGVSLIELVVFIVIVSLAGAALFKVYSYSQAQSADPLVQVRALELAQSRLDEILALKYDANTPTGGIPACGSTAVGAVACNNTPDLDMNDVDDFNNITDEPYSFNVTKKTSSGGQTTIMVKYTRQVTVVTTGNVKLVSVIVTAPTGLVVPLAAQKANF